MTPLTIISGKPLPARIWQHRRMPITICPERIIKWDGAMRHTLSAALYGTGGQREEATPYGGSHCVAGALQARATVRGEPLLAHSGRRKAEQCISDGYLVPVVVVDSKYHLFLLLAQPPPAGGAAAPACQSAGRIASSAASDYRELAAYGRNGAEGSPAEGDFLQKG